MIDVSKLLRSLTKNEQPWVIRSGRSPKMSNYEQIAQVAHFFGKNKQFAQKTDEGIPSPDQFAQIAQDKWAPVSK